MGLFYYGLRDTSATYSVNFLSLVPITTFIFSIICRYRKNNHIPVFHSTHTWSLYQLTPCPNECRMERVGFGRWASKVKTIGATLCVGGALTTSLYKGNEFYIGLSSHHIHTATTVDSSKTHMLRGTLFLLASCFSYTAWFIVQVCIIYISLILSWFLDFE